MYCIPLEPSGRFLDSDFDEAILPNKLTFALEGILQKESELLNELIDKQNQTRSSPSP